MAQQHLHDQLDAFIAHMSTTPADVEMLSKYLIEQPQIATTKDMLPVDEIDERLEIARRITKDTGGSLSAVHLSILMVMPLDQLRKIDPREELPFTSMQRLVRISMYTH